jgi:hypothetical protein
VYAAVMIEGEHGTWLSVATWPLEFIAMMLKQLPTCGAKAPVVPKRSKPAGTCASAGMSAQSVSAATNNESSFFMFLFLK